MFIPPPPGPDSPHDHGAEPSSEPTDTTLHELAGYIIDCLDHGSNPEEIRKSLVAKGLSEVDAEAVVNQVLHHYSEGALGQDYRDAQAMQALGRRNMAIGGFVCIVGLIVTLGSMAAASGGGRFVIAWGAVIFGGIQFLRGMSQANSRV